MTFEPRAAWMARIRSRRAARAAPPGSTDPVVPEIVEVLVGSAVSCDIIRTPSDRPAIGGAEHAPQDSAVRWPAVAALQVLPLPRARGLGYGHDAISARA